MSLDQHGVDTAEDIAQAAEAAEPNAAEQVAEGRVAEETELDEAEDGSPTPVWVTVGFFVLFVVGASSCFSLGFLG